MNETYMIWRATVVSYKFHFFILYFHLLFMPFLSISIIFMTVAFKISFTVYNWCVKNRNFTYFGQLNVFHSHNGVTGRRVPTEGPFVVLLLLTYCSCLFLTHPVVSRITYQYNICMSLISQDIIE